MLGYDAGIATFSEFQKCWFVGEICITRCI